MTSARYWKLLSAALFVVASCQRHLPAQDFEKIAFRVESVWGNRIYLDQGSRVGLRPGGDVVLYPPDGSALVLTVESAGPDRATVLLPASAAPIEVGTYGETLAVSDQLPRSEAGFQGRLGAGEEAASAPAGRPGVQPYPDERRASFEGTEPAGYMKEPRSSGAVSRIEVRVTATSGGSVFLDQGRASGIQIGDEVLLYSPSGGIVSGTIQSVSRNSSRCSVAFGAASIDIGTRGEILVPEDRRQSLDQGRSDAQEKETGRKVPDHPPWTSPPENWNEERPLLAPAFSQPPSERDTRTYGRLYGQYLHTWNFRNSRNQYSLGRLGTDVWMENPFHRGGGLHLDGELNRRDLLLGGTGSEVDSPGRLDRFSYYWGRSEDAPFQGEFGRFLQSEIPELGILDGAELIYRTESADRIGVSLGAMPEPFPDLKTGDDLQTAVFYRFVPDGEEEFSAAVAYQKTWHRGRSDRDLVVGTLDYASPGGTFFLHESVLGDFYGSSDNLKTKAFEITEAHLNGMFRFRPDRGVGVHFSQIRWPQLLRREFLPVFVRQMRSDWVMRYGLFTWRELTETLRLDGRLDHWEDQDRQAGTTWDVRLALRDWLFERGEVAVSIYDTNGIFTSGLGGRLSLHKYFAQGSASVSYDLNGYESLAGPENVFQQAVRATLDCNLGSGRSASLFANYWFGARQDSLALGLFLQKRF
jgi:hypothetical protein